MLLVMSRAFLVLPLLVSGSTATDRWRLGRVGSCASCRGVGDGDTGVLGVAAAIDGA